MAMGELQLYRVGFVHRPHRSQLLAFLKKVSFFSPPTFDSLFPDLGQVRLGSSPFPSLVAMASQ